MSDVDEKLSHVEVGVVYVALVYEFENTVVAADNIGGCDDNLLAGEDADDIAV